MKKERKNERRIVIASGIGERLWIQYQMEDAYANKDKGSRNITCYLDTATSFRRKIP